MSEQKIKLIETDSQFLEMMSNVINNVNGHDWFYMPFWFKKISDGVYEAYFFEDLPKEVIERININRKELTGQ